MVDFLSNANGSFVLFLTYALMDGITSQRAVIFSVPPLFCLTAKQFVSKKHNSPFPSSCLPPLQSESKCEVFLMKNSFHSYVEPFFCP